MLPQILPGRPLYVIPAPLVWLTGALQLAAGIVFLAALAQTDVWRFCEGLSFAQKSALPYNCAQ
ncbi:MAG: hypothetical protein PVF45_05570 [Anaerolineae bacterium]